MLDSELLNDMASVQVLNTLNVGGSQHPWSCWTCQEQATMRIIFKVTSGQEYTAKMCSDCCAKHPAIVLAMLRGGK